MVCNLPMEIFIIERKVTNFKKKKHGFGIFPQVDLFVLDVVTPC